MPKPYDKPGAYRCSDNKCGYDGTLISTWHVIWSGYVRLPRLLPYKKTLEPIELSCYFSWCFNAINNDSFWIVLTWYARIVWDLVTALLMHVIQCKIWVRPGYFIKRVRPGWPGQKVTRLTRMTWPSCNADLSTKSLSVTYCYISLVLIHVDISVLYITYVCFLITVQCVWYRTCQSYCMTEHWVILTLTLLCMVVTMLGCSLLHCYTMLSTQQPIWYVTKSYTVAMHIRVKQYGSVPHYVLLYSALQYTTRIY